MSNTTTRSLSQRAAAVLAGGPATLSKHSARFPQGLAPAFLAYGQGARVWDTEGHRYIDTIAALGPVLLGHNHHPVTEAVWHQAERLASSSLSTTLEVQVAEQLVAMMPGVEMARFALNGKDVNEAAVKLARHVMGKHHIIYCGYAGGFPDYLITTDKHGGLLPHSILYNHQIPWRDWAALNTVLQEGARVGSAHAHADHPLSENLAALILEVPPEPFGTPPDETAAVLRRYADAAHAAGALFILDDVVTGLRYGLAGAQGYYGVHADLITMSKAMANGYPCAALLGPRALMQAFDGGQVFLSTTFGANPIGLAACKATLAALHEPEPLARLKRFGGMVGQALNDYAAVSHVPASVRGMYARYVLDWDDVPNVGTAAEWRTLWLQELCKRGVLASVPWFPMTCYSEELTQELTQAIADTCGALEAVVDGKRAMQDALECPVIEDVFGQRYAVVEQP